jgi:hypothetical protein
VSEIARSCKRLEALRDPLLEHGQSKASENIALAIRELKRWV